MSIRLVIGRPQQNAQLSTAIYREIGAVLNRQSQQDALPKNNIFLIVPEQYTLGAERALMQAVNRPGLIEADVLSLRRLSSRILDETGGSTRQIVDSQGRILLLAKAVAALRGDFRLYRRSSHHSGFIKNLSDVMTEFKQNQIGLEDLEKIVPQLDPDSWIGQKMTEMTAIYRQYEKELGESRWDIDRLNRKLCDGIRQSKMLRHAQIWLDGFFTFSVNDFSLLEAIASQADNLTFSLTGDLDCNVKDGQIFTVCRDTAQRLAAVAKRTGHDFCIENQLEKDGERTPYKVLRDETFAYIQEPWLEKTDFVRIDHYQDPWHEAIGTARQIAKLLREKDWQYQDIAILCGSLEERGSLLLRALNDVQIPAFCDLPVQMSENPLIEGFISAFEAAAENYKTAPLVAYAQSGYAPLELCDYYALENYALAKGIRGLKWLRCIEGDESEDQWDFEKLEVSRKILIEPLKKYADSIRGAKTYRHVLSASVSFLEEIGAYQRLMDYSDQLVFKGDYENAGKVRQVWNLLMDLFDQIDQTMGEVCCDSATFLQVVKSGMETCRIGILPNRRDVVQIIDPFRSRGGKIKALFIVGANEGLLPAEAPDYPLLSEEDRTQLFAMGLPLQKDSVFRKSKMDYSLYLQMMRAEERISVSACVSDETGSPIRPSSLFTSFCCLFPANNIHREEEALDWIVGGAGTLDEAVCRLKKRDRSGTENCRITAVLDWYRSQPKWRDLTLQFEGAENYQGISTPDLAPQRVQNLYGDSMSLSVSRIEKFNTCPFAHFIHFGLKPHEREVFEVSKPDIGNLLHKVLETCFKRMTEQGLTADDLRDGQCVELVNTVMSECLDQPKNRVFSDTAANRFLSRKLRRVVQHTFQMVINHLKQGCFDFRYSEQGFIKSLKIADFPQDLKLKGTIDRIDLYEKDGESFTKIIDYKTGSTQVDFSKIYYGVSIQLLLYLQEGMEWIAHQYPNTLFLPAGAFYLHVNDPMVSEIDPVKLEEEINKAFRMEGIYLDDEGVIQAMDSDAASKKSMVFDRKPSLGFDRDELQILLDFVQIQMTDSIRKMLRGKIAADPVRIGQDNPCTYCDCREICQPDALLNRQAFYRSKEKISKETLLAEAVKFTKEKENVKGGETE